MMNFKILKNNLYMVVFFADVRTSPVRIDKNEIVQINNGDLNGKEITLVITF